MDVEKPQVESRSNHSSDVVDDKALPRETSRLPNEAGDDDIVTLKTWIVVVVCIYLVREIPSR